MHSRYSPWLLLHLMLALLLVVNGIAPALAAGASHPAGASSAAAVPPEASADAGCHDEGAALSEESGIPATCCEEGPCRRAACDCPCMVSAAAMPLAPAPAEVARAVVLAGRLLPDAHAPPPAGTVIRPPIA